MWRRRSPGGSVIFFFSSGVPADDVLTGAGRRGWCDGDEGGGATVWEEEPAATGW